MRHSRPLSPPEAGAAAASMAPEHQPSHDQHRLKVSSSSSSSGKWQCHACTFSNSKKVDVCQVCCKSRNSPADLRQPASLTPEMMQQRGGDPSSATGSKKITKVALPSLFVFLARISLVPYFHNCSTHHSPEGVILLKTSWDQDAWLEGTCENWHFHPRLQVCYGFTVDGGRKWARATDAERVGTMRSSYFLCPRPMATLIQQTKILTSAASFLFIISSCLNLLGIACGKCTLVNDRSLRVCDACGATLPHHIPPRKKRGESNEEEEEDEDQYESSTSWVSVVPKKKHRSRKKKRQKTRPLDENRNILDADHHQFSGTKKNQQQRIPGLNWLIPSLQNRMHEGNN